MTAWYDLKHFIEHLTGFSMDALHVLAGVAVQLLAAALLRRPVSRWAPWLVVLALELLNEASDLFLEQWPEWGDQLGEGAKDLVLTMVLPTLLLVAARFRPALFARP